MCGRAPARGHTQGQVASAGEAMWGCTRGCCFGRRGHVGVHAWVLVRLVRAYPAVDSQTLTERGEGKLAAPHLTRGTKGK